MERTDVTSINRHRWSGVRYEGRIKADLYLDFDHVDYSASVSVWTDNGWQRIGHFTPNREGDRWKSAAYNPSNIADADEEELRQSLETDLDYLIEFGREFLAGL